MKHDEFGIDVKREDFEKTDLSRGTYVSFAYSPEGDGSKFAVEMGNPLIENKDGHVRCTILLDASTLDAYIYGLQDMKQKLELLRMKNVH